MHLQELLSLDTSKQYMKESSIRAENVNTRQRERAVLLDTNEKCTCKIKQLIYDIFSNRTILYKNVYDKVTLLGH